MNVIERLHARAQEGRGCNLNGDEAAAIVMELALARSLANQGREARNFRNVRLKPMRLSVGDTPACLRDMSSKFAEAARAAVTPFEIHMGQTTAEDPVGAAFSGPEL